MSWTDERVALLKQLWGEGKTAAEIAETLGGVTRNAVIGKAHRLKLSNRVSPIQQNDNQKPAPAPEKKPVVVEKVAAKPAGGGVKMADLKDKMCRWPIGDPKDPDFRFCGDSSIPGMPYCQEHARMAYQVPGRLRTLNAEDFEDNKDKDDGAEEMDVRAAG